MCSKSVRLRDTIDTSEKIRLREGESCATAVPREVPTRDPLVPAKTEVFCSEDSSTSS